MQEMQPIKNFCPPLKIRDTKVSEANELEGLCQIHPYISQIGWIPHSLSDFIRSYYNTWILIDFDMIIIYFHTKHEYIFYTDSLQRHAEMTFFTLLYHYVLVLDHQTHRFPSFRALLYSIKHKKGTFYYS